MLVPPLRWVGGKRRFAADIATRVGAVIANGGRYIEPFLGSGAVALSMPTGTAMVLSDICKPLSYLWWWIRLGPYALAEYAASYGINIDDGWNTAEGFAAARLQHNQAPYSDDSFEPSARFLWLMSACFNGLYRENSTGLYNVPWGKRKKIVLPSGDDLQAIATHIKDAEMYAGVDFEVVIDYAEKGDVIYVDPPYDGDADSFVGYSKHRFGPLEQVRLAAACENAVDRGAVVIQTNADTDRIRGLYKRWTFEEISEPRNVAADGDARTAAPCLIITSPKRG